MPQPIESVINNQQRESLEIVDFIFHIIDPDEAEEEDGVIFLDEVNLAPQQKSFFLDRLREMAEGTQYIFKPESVHLKEKCEQLLQDRSRFPEFSRQITSDFAGRHKGNMSAGVFIVCNVRYLVSANNYQHLAFLVKMDRQASFSYSYKEILGRRVATVEANANSLNESKAAIQKSALVDTSTQFAWDVLAFDRAKKPGLSDYFRGFLGVTERQQDSVLTRTTHSVVKKWARAIPAENLPPEEDVFTFTGRSLNYLSDHDTFDTESYLDAVVRDADADRKKILIGSLREALSESGVAGQQFRPQPGSLRDKDRKQVYKTAEGVTITYEGTRETAGMTIEPIGGGGSRIIIETNHLEAKA